MAGYISFDGVNLQRSMKQLIDAIENNAADSITQIPTSVKMFTVNGTSDSDGGVGSLSGLVGRLQQALQVKGFDAQSIVDGLSNNLDALDLVIKDMTAREDENASSSTEILQQVHDAVEVHVNSVQSNTPAAGPQTGGTGDSSGGSNTGGDQSGS